MSDTFDQGPQDGIRDEVRLDLDAEAIEDWDAVSGDYSRDPDADPGRPALTEEEDDGSDGERHLREDDEEDDLAQDDDEHDDEEE